MSFDQELLESAHQHCAAHRNEIQASDICGCFFCQQSFTPAEIADWHEETRGNYSRQPDPWTALCPKCGIDTVIGSASGFPVGNPQFLSAMHQRWFG